MSLTSPTPMLGSERPLLRRLRKHEVIWPDGPPHARLGHCGATADFQATPEPPQKGERPQLRVLDGGRSMSKPGTS